MEPVMDQYPLDPAPPPRKPKPVPDDRPRPAGDAAGGDGSTFRPNPLPANPMRPGAVPVKKRKTTGPDGETFETPAGGPTWVERILFGRVSTAQLAQLCRQLAAYLQAGVDFTKAFSSLEKQFGGTALAPVLRRVQASVRRGTTLEEAMASEPQTFGTFFLSMIRVAEARGGLPETLREMGRHYEKRQRLVRQARSAMIYPVIVLTIATAVSYLITVILLPLFASMLQDIARGKELPLPSQVLIAISAFMRKIGWWLVPVVAVAAPIALLQFYKTPPGKGLIDRIALSLPVMGKLLRKLDTSRFARTLSVLLNAGVDYGPSIDMTANVLRMAPIKSAVLSVRQSVMNGQELSRSLEAKRVFDDDVISVIDSGEETGKLPENLAHLADDYDEQIEFMVKNLGELVQPILMVFLGGIVLFIILAVLMPIIQLMNSLSGG
jgi:type IV pilus assembly protein PilC